MTTIAKNRTMFVINSLLKNVLRKFKPYFKIQKSIQSCFVNDIIIGNQIVPQLNLDSLSLKVCGQKLMESCCIKISTESESSKIGAI